MMFLSTICLMSNPTLCAIQVWWSNKESGHTRAQCYKTISMSRGSMWLSLTFHKCHTYKYGSILMKLSNHLYLHNVLAGKYLCFICQKSRSHVQILEKPCHNSRGHIYDAILLKLGGNIYLCLKTRSTGKACTHFLATLGSTFMTQA